MVCVKQVFLVGSFNRNQFPEFHEDSAIHDEVLTVQSIYTNGLAIYGRSTGTSDVKVGNSRRRIRFKRDTV